jgi:hypothetical protein
MFLEFKAMLNEQNSMQQIGEFISKVMEFVQLGKIEKGSVFGEGKFMSLLGRWMTAKKQSDASEISENVEGSYIKRDSLIRLKAKRGNSESIEYYRVLAIFSKSYNKWYLHWDEDKVLYESNSKKYKILARMVVQTGQRFKEVDLVAGGNWSPRNVYVLRYMSEVLSLDGDLGIDYLD